MTGSVNVSSGSSINFTTTPAASTTTTAKISFGKVPSPPGSLTSTLIKNYGADDFGLILQSGFGTTDMGGIKITDDGVAIFGAADEDLFRVVDEDSNVMRFVIDNNGNVGIGVDTTTYKLQVNGSFSATTKSFNIPHPTKENTRLVYASLEGPEHGIYYRGKSNSDVIDLLGIIDLPDYWDKLVYSDSLTVHITAIGKTNDNKIRNYSIEKIENNKVFVYTDSNDKVYDYYYIVYAERKDVDKLVVEKEEIK